MAQIFISHSANHDAGVAALRDAVAKRLAELEHMPLFDAALINPGDRWRAKLLGWLGSCHGAVMLLTSRAIYRDWVRAEATIIGWRAYLNPAMRVVPVLLDEDMSSSWLDELGLEPVQLRENVQFLKASELGNPGTEALAEAIAQRFVGYQAGPARDDPMAQWLKQVRVHLGGNGFLEEAAELLGVPELDRIDSDSLCGAVTDRLLHSNAVAIEQAVLELIKDPKLRRSWASFAPLVSCAWLPADMAPVLFDVAAVSSTSHVTAVQVTIVKTAQRLLSRLTCCDNRYTVIGPISLAGTGDDDEGELLHRYISAIFGKVGATSEAQWPTAFASMQEARGRPVFVILGPEALETNVLGHLVNRFGELVFVCAGTREALERAVLGASATLPAVELTPRLFEEFEARGDAVAERIEAS